MNRARSLVFGMAALCMSAVGHAADLRPGLWEFRSTRMSIAGLPDMSSQMAQMQQHLKNLPPDMRRMMEQQMAARGVSLGNDGAVRSCISPEQAKQDNIYSGKIEGNCTLGNVVKTGNTVTGRLSCTQPDASGDFNARVDGPEHFTTRVNMKSTSGDLKIETDARWLSAHCAAPRGVVPPGPQ
ncbi:DUF3617 domain-containing protein [Aromatoleum diolicum]|uniref:DUF3617 family protein n=1 Tax=Aromatoleum diolicum TaxID=75796 RepID=A0ABX1QE62_9RHOO|nr:DUF3617 domain-containing protein [Aromatoleum diolicum]NMG75355.1 DUF3617 family protein [Aromatoleum diolicum]